MSIRPEVRSAAAYAFEPREHAVKLDQNESPYDLPAELKRELFERLLTVPFHRYPDIHADRLRNELGAKVDWPASGIVVSAGSNVLIQAFVAAAGIGRRVVTVTPTFSVYRMQARLLGAELTEVPLAGDFSLPVDAFQAELERGSGVVFLAHPAAPTGNALDERAIERLVAAAPDWTFVLDEAYAPFAGTDLSRLARAHPNVACLRTLSKAYGLAGVRLGYALAQDDLATNLRKLLLPFSVSVLQIETARLALEHPERETELVAEVRRERGRIVAGLREIGLEAFDSVTNFVLFRVGDAGVFYDGLRSHDVLVRRQDSLHGLGGCLRVSVGTPEQNDRFLHAAARVAGEAVRG